MRAKKNLAFFFLIVCLIVVGCKKSEMNNIDPGPSDTNNMDPGSSDTNNGAQPTDTIPREDNSTDPELTRGGLAGYIGYSVSQFAAEKFGVSFYTAAWKLTKEPLINFQIGLPGTWVLPDNSNNTSIALCPQGTFARDNWPERGPTYGDVFQTLEGGLGYWQGNRFRYGSPKFSMNATSQCYDFEIASPGWSFFYDNKTLDDNKLGIAQLHNRLLVPPDGLTFAGNPNGDFMGYAYMALPFTDAHEDEVPTGNQSWTCFINTVNFKGPIAYYLPETWSKLSKNHPEIIGKGLDARPGIIGTGAIEINTVPLIKARDSSGTLFTKIPELNFPVNAQGEALLVQDFNYYTKEALYNDILKLRSEGTIPNGSFKTSGILSTQMNSSFIEIAQENNEIENFELISTPYIRNSNFGLKWANTEFEAGKFPQYFKKENNVFKAILEEEVPSETKLLAAEFETQSSERSPYVATMTSSWTSPGPASEPFQVTLNDGSTVTYVWYKFIDQPVFQQYNWTTEKKNALQEVVEKIHANWPINRDYIPAPSTGNLIAIDPNLIIQPPAGMEIGYVPIVIRQER